MLSAALIVVSAPLFFVFFSPWGYATILAGLLLSWSVSRPLSRDLLLIALPIVGIAQISVEANLEWGNILLLGTVLTSAVAVPYALSRWVFKDHAIQFPGRPGEPWTRLEWSWLGLDRKSVV